MVVLRALAIVVVALVLSELFVRGISGHLPNPTSAGEGEVLAKDVQLAGVAPGGVVFVGGSSMNAGGDVDEFVAVSGTFQHGYNASLNGARLGAQATWVDQVVLPRLRPALVVQAVDPNLVMTLGNSFTDLVAFDNVIENNIEVIDDSAGARATRWASEWSYLVRYRALLRSPSVVWDAAWGTVFDEPPPPNLTRPEGFWEQNLDGDGQVLEYREGEAPAVAPAGVAERIAGLLDSDYSFTTFDRLLGTYEATDTPVVLVIPPVSVDSLVAAGVDMARWRDATQRIVARAGERGVPILDFTDQGYDHTQFHDPLHLNGTGSVRFSDQLAAAVDELCRQGAVACT